jgi:hypothetical protein
MFEIHDAAKSFKTIFGTTAPDSITNKDADTPTPHDWYANADHLYQTNADLAAEWMKYYKIMLAGHASTLNDIQRLEGNAEAVFLNTGIKKLTAAEQERDREDVQREYDAIAAAMKLAGVNDRKALTEQSYLLVDQTLRDSPALLELAMQGHGLNNSGIPRYSGYTNDFQNGVDGTTMFVGGGFQDNDENALTDFFDDNVISHLLFPVVYENGTLTELDQNGDAEEPLNNELIALNDTMIYRVYRSDDFSASWPDEQSLANTRSGYWTAFDYRQLDALERQEAAPAPEGEVKTLYGADISDTMSFNIGNGVTHVWKANADGLFTTTTNLAAEWMSAYVDYVTTGGADLTAEQRLEANAESVFVNTGLNKLGAGAQERDREDAQREFDAMFAAMKECHINPDKPFSDNQYLTFEHALENNAALEELAIQGHGLTNPSSSKYDGFVNDFQWSVDDTTLFDGPGPLGGQAAIPVFFAINIMSYVENPTIVINGTVVQLDQNGQWGEDLNDAVAGLNLAISGEAYDAQDYGQPQA